MPAPIVRAKYDQLSQIAATFGQQAELTRHALQELRRQQETLKGGDWLGKGATAFYAEMDSQVVPTLGRLIHALEQAANTTQQINQTVQQAEADAAALFKLTGAGGSAAPNGSAGLAAAPAEGTSAFAARPSPGPTRSGQQKGQAQPTSILGQLLNDPKLSQVVSKHPLLITQLERLDRAGWTMEMGKSMGAKVFEIDRKAQKITVNPDRLIDSLTDVSNHILYGDIKLLAKLDPKLVAQAEKDPVLMEQLRQMDQANWKVEMSPDPGSSAARLSKQQILVDPENPLASLRDGVRAAVRGDDQDSPLQPGMTRNNYMAVNRGRRLENDAAETLSYYNAYNAVHGRMPDKSPFTPNGQVSRNADKYKSLAQGYSPFDSSQTNKRDALVGLWLNEPAGFSNADKYRDMYWEKWDKANAGATP